MRIFNLSVSIGVYPDAWKHSYVTPVFKKGDVHDSVNYRPIALLPVLSKVFECLINDNLRSFIESNQIIDTAQHGFWKKYSCETALLGLTKQLFELRDAKKFTCITALDFSRAFNTLNINILIKRIASIADAITAEWFASYLTGRQQSTKYCGAVSDPLPLSSGMPEGSVLWPMLFTLYIKKKKKYNRYKVFRRV